MQNKLPIFTTHELGIRKIEQLKSYLQYGIVILTDNPAFMIQDIPSLAVLPATDNYGEFPIGQDNRRQYKLMNETNARLTILCDSGVSLLEGLKYATSVAAG